MPEAFIFQSYKDRSQENNKDRLYPLQTGQKPSQWSHFSLLSQPHFLPHLEKLLFHRIILIILTSTLYSSKHMTLFHSVFLPFAPVSFKEADIVALVRIRSYCLGRPRLFFPENNLQKGNPQSLLVLILSSAKDADCDSSNPSLEPNIPGDL